MPSSAVLSSGRRRTNANTPVVVACPCPSSPSPAAPNRSNSRIVRRDTTTAAPVHSAITPHASHASAQQRKKQKAAAAAERRKKFAAKKSAASAPPLPALAATALWTSSVMEPAKAHEFMVKVAAKKAHMKLYKSIVMAMMSGFYVMIGAHGMISLLTQPDYGTQTSLLAGVVFALAIIAIITIGGELFTGNCMLIAGVLSRRIHWYEMVKNWFIVYFFNFAGNILFAALVFGTGYYGWNHEDSPTKHSKSLCAIVSKKAETPAFELFFRAVLANFCVCLAVMIGWAANSVEGKVLGMVWPISVFVLSGFEHSIANQGFFTLATMVNCPTAHGWYWVNLAVTTPGNICGAWIMAIAYYFVSAYSDDAISLKYHPTYAADGVTIASYNDPDAEASSSSSSDGISGRDGDDEDGDDVIEVEDSDDNNDDSDEEIVDYDSDVNGSSTHAIIPVGYGNNNAATEMLPVYPSPFSDPNAGSHSVAVDMTAMGGSSPLPKRKQHKRNQQHHQDSSPYGYVNDEDYAHVVKPLPTTTRHAAQLGAPPSLSSSPAVNKNSLGGRNAQYLPVNTHSGSSTATSPAAAPAIVSGRGAAMISPLGDEEAGANISGAGSMMTLPVPTPTGIGNHRAPSALGQQFVNNGSIATIPASAHSSMLLLRPQNNGEGDAVDPSSNPSSYSA